MAFTSHLEAVDSQAVNDYVTASTQNNVRRIVELATVIKVSPNVSDRYGLSPLMYAAMNGHITAVKKLIELGSDVDYQRPDSGDTALHLAAQCGHTRTVEMLIKGNANIELRNNCGKTAYEIAQDFGHGENKVMKRLFQSTSSSSDSSDSSPKAERGEQLAESSTRPSDSKPSGRISKDRSLLPCKHLLDIFQKTGVYSILQSGLGFSLLCRDGSVEQMALEAARTLNISPNDASQMQTKLYSMMVDLKSRDEIWRKESKKPMNDNSELMLRYSDWKLFNEAKLKSIYWYWSLKANHKPIQSL